MRLAGCIDTTDAGQSSARMVRFLRVSVHCPMSLSALSSRPEYHPQRPELTLPEAGIDTP
jgi:hypothetical protein